MEAINTPYRRRAGRVLVERRSTARRARRVERARDDCDTTQLTSLMTNRSLMHAPAQDPHCRRDERHRARDQRGGAVPGAPCGCDIPARDRRGHAVELDVRFDESVRAGLRKATERLSGRYRHAGLYTGRNDRWPDPSVELDGVAARVRRQHLRSRARDEAYAPPLPAGAQRVFQFISSTAAVRGARGAAPYATSKAALNSLAVNVSKEYGRFNVRAFCIMPGFVDGGILDKLDGDKRSALVSQIPLNRLCLPAEVANFCVSTIEASTYLTGTNLTLDGGMNV